MTNIYSIQSSASSVSLQKVPVDQGAIPDGFSTLTKVNVGDKTILYAYNKTEKTSNAYQLTDNAPFITPLIQGSVELSLFEWDILRSFVLGNKPYLLTYESKKGTMGFYEIKPDGSLTAPYTFMNQRSWPTQNFSEIEPFVSLGLLYVLCYDVVKGTVAIFSLDVISSSANGIPPLNMLNVWYHQWARGWQEFAFFQLGESNFFFKINKAKLNVNIDHIQDNPAMGTVEIGSWLQALLPNALDVTSSAIIPWSNGEPYLATYDGKDQNLNIYRIYSDCQGWTNLNTTKVELTARMLSYRIGETSYLLLGS